MQKIFKKRKNMILFLIAMGLLSCSIAAKPTLKTVKAYLNPTMVYTLDGQKVLQNTSTITYGDKTYVPLAEVAKIMGLEMKLENNIVVMTTKGDQSAVPAPVTTGSAVQITPDTAGSVFINKAFVKEIKVESKTVTVHKDGREDKTENYVVLNISDITKILREGDDKLYALGDLKEGMPVSVKHSSVTTSSLPLQTTAFEIKMLAQNAAELQKGLAELKDAKILEVNNGSKYIVVISKDSKSGQLKLLFSNKTKVKYEGLTKQPNINALKAGQIVDIKLDGAVAADAPEAKILEIVVKNTAQQPAEADAVNTAETADKAAVTDEAAINKTNKANKGNKGKQAE